MDISLKILVLPANVIAFITVPIIAVIFLAPNFTIASAQQLSTSQPSGTQSPILLSAKDSFRVQLPEGWVIQDVNNTGFILAAEVLQGYGILAQLCPQEQGQSAPSNVSSTSTSNNRYSGSCQHAREGEVIHIIRYPNLGARLGISSDEDIFTIINNRDTLPNAVLAYHFQKLQEVGYRDFKIINSIDTTINVDNSTTDLSYREMATRTTTAVPAKLVEMTYSTNFAPNETRTGYFLLTATAATPRNLGTMTGYSIFYEGNSTPTATTAEQGTTISTGSTVASPTSLTTSLSSSPPVKQVFDSFELIAARTEPLTVEITSEDTEGIAPATFEFEANVAGGMQPYTISWDYGDEGTSGGEEEREENDEDVEHTFDVAGTYNMRVSVTDSTGRTASDSILIIVDEPPPLTAVDIISNGTEGIAPATFEFEAEVTGGIEPYTYRWNFGDGSRANDDDEDVEHTFDVASMYNVSLIVIDSTGQAASDSILIIVDEPPPPPPLTLIEIIPSDTEGIAPATFEFEAEVTGGIEPYTYRWNFGDGSRETGDDETIEHTFEEPGRYNVNLIVIDSTGQAASDNIPIIVEPPSPPPLASVNIISNGTQGIAPATFEFEANVAGGTGPYTYSWEFGDGSSRESNARTVSHTFDQAGRYNVGLVVMDSRNQIAFDSIAITVEEGESPTIEEEEEPNLDEVDDNNSGLDTFFDLDDSLERRELQNNGITVGGTSAADDYDATADD